MQPARALVFDPDPAIQALVWGVLADAGFAVGVEIDGSAVGLVVADVEEMAVAEAVSGDATLVLFVGASGVPPILDSRRAFLAKPFSRDELCAEIARLVGNG
ncbi:MAG: hypothetical protein ACOZNI_13610 [Myxococcota bacterium]